MASRDEIQAKIAAAAAGGRTGKLVLTETGDMEHRQGTWTTTMCGRDIDKKRTANPDRDSYFPCITCSKSAERRF